MNDDWRISKLEFIAHPTSGEIYIQGVVSHHGIKCSKTFAVGGLSPECSLLEFMDFLLDSAGKLDQMSELLEQVEAPKESMPNLREFTGSLDSGVPPENKYSRSLGADDVAVLDEAVFRCPKCKGELDPKKLCAACAVLNQRIAEIRAEPKDQPKR